MFGCLVTLPYSLSFLYGYQKDKTRNKQRQRPDGQTNGKKGGEK
jgi:hypothetical protein